jgi:cytochrome c556
MIRAMLAVFALSTAIALAHSDPVSQRKDLMKGNLEGAKAVVRMVRGQNPFNAEKVNAAFEQWMETAKKLPNLFPEPPAPGQDTRALPKIWENKPDFAAKIAAFEKAVVENKDKTQTLDELKVAVPAVSKACSDCHELYRRPEQ